VNSWLAVGGEFSGLYGTETETRQFMVGDMKKDFDVKPRWTVICICSARK
jgi:hypothetical protein